MSAATLFSSTRTEARKITVPNVQVLRTSRHPLQVANLPTREHAIQVGRSLVYRQGRRVVMNDAPGDLFNQRADADLL